MLETYVVVVVVVVRRRWLPPGAIIVVVVVRFIIGGFFFLETGNKIEAKLFVESMKSKQRPRCVPGFALNDADARALDRLASDENDAEANVVARRIARQCESLGVPILIKAADGGGGKGSSRRFTRPLRLSRAITHNVFFDTGMRIVEDPFAGSGTELTLSASFVAQLHAARRESLAAFGSDRVLIERYVAQGRHIEVQILGDKHGDCVHLFERECSIQRRHQKLVEETPSVALDDALRQSICLAAQVFIVLFALYTVAASQKEQRICFDFSIFCGFSRWEAKWAMLALERWSLSLTIVRRSSSFSKSTHECKSSIRSPNLSVMQQPNQRAISHGFFFCLIEKGEMRA